MSFIPRYQKITVQLIPETSFFINVRSKYPKEWDIIRQLCYKRGKYCCEICGNKGYYQGFKHPVECHELWNFDEKTRMQMLTDFVSLCPMCHKAHHLGYAEMNGQLLKCLDHIKLVNKISNQQVLTLIQKALEDWTRRSKINWTLDMSFIDKFIMENKKHSVPWAVS